MPATGDAPPGTDAALPDHHGFLVGAAIGTGLVALAAERGQADFLLALNAGRLRSMGLPSISSMLPFAAANDLVMSFVEHELVRPTRIPVFVGLCVWEPPARLEARLDAIDDAGLAGIANFPTTVHYPEEAARTLDANGQGFAAELELLERARARGQRIIVYAKTRSQAEQAAALRPDMLCVNFGWNAGGRLTELQPEVSIDEAILRARDIARMVRRRSPDTVCLIEGGPIVHPHQVAEICVEAGMQGYIGGSTIDRLPIEDSVVDATLAFKSAGVARQRERGERATLLSQAAAVGLHGGSEALVAALRRLQALADGDSPIVVSGPPGTQRHAALAFARREAGFGADAPTTLLVSDHPEPQLGMRLFGHGDGRQGLLIGCHGRPLLIETLDGLSRRWQRKLVRLLSRGMVTPFRGNRAVATRPWLQLLAERPLAELHAEGTLIDDLYELLRTREVVMPGLAERSDALAAIIAGHCASRGLDLYFSDSAITLLQRLPWHGNVPELERLVDRIRAAGYTGEISAGALEPFLDPEPRGPARAARSGDAAADESEWLLAALRRHAFNRSAAARALGISRKTLYNRMQRLGL